MPGNDDVTADRAYTREFLQARSRELRKLDGVEYAEIFHPIGPGTHQAVRRSRACVTALFQYDQLVIGEPRQREGRPPSEE